MESKIILGRILQRFIDQGYAQVESYNRFNFIEIKGAVVWVSREKGKDTPIPFAKIIDGIEAYKTDASLYDQGPVALRDFGITHVTSPVFALLHLLEREDYV